MSKEHPEWFDPNEREEDGRWKKGVSGNPKGRGHSRGKATMAVEAMLGDELDRLTRKAVELAAGWRHHSAEDLLGSDCTYQERRSGQFPLAADGNGCRSAGCRGGCV
jgi:hypothetical protein